MWSPSTAVKQYVFVFALLIGLLTISIPASLYGSGTTSVLIIYGVAVAKAYLVLSVYMHLNVEPWFVTIILVGCLLAIIYMFLLLYPDIVWNGMAAL